MTSLRRLPISVGSRRNTLDQEREQLQKNQEISFRKAVNDEEAPIKMKHTRNLIIGTHTERSGSMFWGLVALSPPLNSDVTAWKFCHTLHLILRDGHPSSLKDSIQQISKIRNLGEHFRYLPGGYGSLIPKYCGILLCKLQFHQHYPRFPGTLQVSADDLDKIAENDVNNYFEMAVEMLEYMENILKLYETVFESLDPSRANSMTKTGQCRLAPLIPCIQDSSSLYDFIVRILFRLHKMVSLDMLNGHRMRFNQQFKGLQSFYNNTRNLQYFKTLIQVPHLPQVAPNFMIEAELRSHVAPVVVVEEEEAESGEGQESFLVDTTDPSPPPVPPHPHPDVVNSHNGPLMELLAEKDGTIESLQTELRESRSLAQKLRSEITYFDEKNKMRIEELESILSEKESELVTERESRESVMAQVEAATRSAEASTRLTEEETRRSAAEDKFAKMKEVYQKLRDEHINLIRAKAEIEKALAEERQKLSEEKSKRGQIESQFNDLRDENTRIEDVQRDLLRASQDKRRLEEDLSRATEDRDRLTATHEALLSDNGKLTQRIKNLEKDSEIKLSNAEEDLRLRLRSCLAKSVKMSKRSVEYSLSHFDNGAHLVNKCTPEYCLLLREPLLCCVGALVDAQTTERNGGGASPLDVLETLPSLVDEFGHFVSTFLVHAKAASHTAPSIETAESLVGCLEDLGRTSVATLEKINDDPFLRPSMDHLTELIEKCFGLTRGCEDSIASESDAAAALDAEMAAMNDAIAAAADRFNALLRDSRANHTGARLEVNEGILGTCSELMSAVKVLVQRASELQKEIVAAGRGGASPTDFYKRNHRWTEGLISGAKTVAIACKGLVESADEVVVGEGKWERVMVSSREVAASSMQLVMASRVKADKESAKLGGLNAAAKNISALTGNVVATAESCREKVQDAAALDFSALSHHSAKRLEMEMMVKALETEKLLETQREQLVRLRKQHYHLAGDIESARQVP